MRQFCWLSSHMGINGGGDVSECLISSIDAYQYISQYVRDLWQSEWDTAVNNKPHATLDRRTAAHLQIIYQKSWIVQHFVTHFLVLLKMLSMLF